MLVAVGAIAPEQMALGDLGRKARFDEGSLSYDLSGLVEHAGKIALIESVGGRTLEEAYYQSYGLYLMEQAKLQVQIVKDLGQRLNEVGGAMADLSARYGALGKLGFAAICLFAGIAFLCALYQLVITFPLGKRKQEQPEAA